MLQVEYLQVHNEENHSCENAYKATTKICIYHKISIKLGFKLKLTFNHGCIWQEFDSNWQQKKIHPDTNL